MTKGKNALVTVTGSTLAYSSLHGRRFRPLHGSGALCKGTRHDA